MRHYVPLDPSFIGRGLARLARHVGSRLAVTLSDPRRVNPIYVFAVGLSVMLPIWLLFLRS